MKTLHSLFILLGLSVLIIIVSCNSDEDTNPLVPASKFTGRWKSENPIQVKIKTDYCTTNLEDVATMDWMVNWEVTETDDPNVVNIVMHYTSSNFTITNPECTFGAGYVPEPQPIYMKDYVTDNSITIEYDNQDILTMDYVNNEITGKLSYSYCIAYCQEIYTDENDFKVAPY
jgi:hypothetical protein